MKTLILDHFEATCERLPDKTAFVDAQEEMTFAQLRGAARAVGTALIAKTSPREKIGFYMDKSARTVAGFLGAVYASCAYAQLNLRYPPARIAGILDTLGADIVVTDREHAEALAGAAGDRQVLLIEDLLQTPPDEAALARVRVGMIDLDPLYVNFTSGSTGSPKGVVVGHRSVIDFIGCFAELFSITERDVLANQAPFDFDVSVKDIYSGLFTGATVAIVPTAYFTQPVKLMDFLCEHDATVLVWAVSALCFLTTMNALAYRTPEHLRAILFSGEVMPIRHLNRLREALPEATFVNLYGPTEITCNCTYYVVDREFAPGDALPIGVPFPNERVLLLTDEGREARPGEVGELCVAGTALALGYLNDPERTARAFTPNPLNAATPETIYRTGDLVRLCENGEMVYVSRKDFQIKHMGHRIELGEIENALGAVEGVERACCLYVQEKGRIVAFITGDVDKEFALSALRETLPAYMIPNALTRLDAMPLNKNGKIDRDALRALLPQARTHSR